jgi:hypothetical protein
MRVVLHRALALIAVLSLAACAGLLTPKSIEVDEATLQRAIADRFPVETRWLGAFDVSVTSPRLRLLPQTNRIATDIDVTVGDRLFVRNLRGSLSVESGLRFEPRDSTLRLAQVRVERFAIAGLPEASLQTARLGSLLVEQVLEGAVLYTLSEDQKARLRRRGVQPGAVQVKPGALSIALEPLPPG